MFEYFMAQSDIDYEDFVNSFSLWHSARRFAYRNWVRVFYKDAFVGGQAKNVTLYDMDLRQCKLLDFMNDARPLVLLFASCT